MDHNKEGVQMLFPGLTSDCLALDTPFKLLLGQEWRLSYCKKEKPKVKIQCPDRQNGFGKQTSTENL